MPEEPCFIKFLCKSCYFCCCMRLNAAAPVRYVPVKGDIGNITQNLLQGKKKHNLGHQWIHGLVNGKLKLKTSLWKKQHLWNWKNIEFFQCFFLSIRYRHIFRTRRWANIFSRFTPLQDRIIFHVFSLTLLINWIFNHFFNTW